MQGGVGKPGIDEKDDAPATTTGCCIRVIRRAGLAFVNPDRQKRVVSANMIRVLSKTHAAF